MKLEIAIAPTRLVAMCLGPEAGGAFDICEVPRRRPGPDEIEIVVEAASVNPVDVRRAVAYGRRLLSLMGASWFPMTLGNDFAGVVAAARPGSFRAAAVGFGDSFWSLSALYASLFFAWSLIVMCSQPTIAHAANWLSTLAFALLGPLWAFQVVSSATSSRMIAGFFTVVMGFCPDRASIRVCLPFHRVRVRCKTAL
jgi:hypothetical protein